MPKWSRVSVLIVLTMALGLGATTALFSVTDGVLLKPLPWSGADRIIQLKERRGGHAPRFGSFTNAEYLAWREQPATIDDIAAWSSRTATLSGLGDPERIRAANVTASLFRVIGARPIAGSLFSERDETSPVVVISESLWRTRFNGAESAIGKGVQLDGDSYTIVGVLPDASSYPDRQTRAWLPFHVPPTTGNQLSMFESIARLRPGMTPAQAEAEGAARGRSVANTGMTTMAIFGGDGPVDVTATPLVDAMTGDIRQPLILLLAAVGLLLLISATNVAGLQLARATARRREFAIRASLGASNGRLLRQLVGENVRLSLIGAAAGVALAWGLVRSAPTVLPADFPRVTELALDWTAVLFAATLATVSGLVSGLWLATRMRRLDLMAALIEDGNAPVGAGIRTSAARARLVIVTGQVAIACLLLVGALLLGRSFVSLLHADRGFDPARILTARLSTPTPQFTPARRSDVLGEIADRLARLPGVDAAAFTTELPLTPGGSTSAFTLPARDGSGSTIQVQASPRIVSYGYFAALGLRVLAGRPLLDTDTATSEPVVVVNETFRKRYLGNESIGSKLPMALWGQNQTGDATIVGVVDDVRYIGATSTSLAEIYFSHRQLKVGVRPTTSSLLVRSTGDPMALAGLVRSTVAAADRSLVPESVVTLERRLLSGSLARPRLYALLIVSFAGIALLITGVGLYSVLSFAVSQRTRELGVRAALGATRGDLVRLVLRQAGGVAVAGIVIGLVASLWLARYTASLLYGVTPTDAVTYAIVPIVMLAVIAIACLVPSRRAAKLDPLKALKS